MHDTVKRATYVGFVAIGIWTIQPLLISEINGLPIFELLAIIFFSSFLLTFFRLAKQKRWHIIKQPLYVWLAGFLGICASDFAYIHGAQYAPIAHVDLIDYLWPCLVIAFACMLPKERFSLQHLLGAILGLLGIVILVAKQVDINGFSFNYCIGYGLALLGALLWGGYSAFSRHHKALPTEMIGLYCGLGAVVCFVLHLKFETFVMPSWSQGSMAVITGLTGAGLAYQLWDFGVKFGNIYLLSAATYIARIAAMGLLVIFGKEPFTISLVIACLLSSCGVFISGLDTNTFNKVRQRGARFFQQMQFTRRQSLFNELHNVQIQPEK
ncbi:MAG: DMT family transporter [Proteobacteria bacterium]|nr:DMT family transporter [Pseudomonadota bacterium]